MLLTSTFNEATLAAKLLFAAIAGLASHNLYFIRGEHHLRAPALLLGAIFTSACIFGLNYRLGFAQALVETLYIVGAFNAALFSSMVFYRTTFHPLCRFPGPRLAKVSKLWHVYHVLESKNHLLLEEMHQKYGSIVRTGPSELTIFKPEIFHIIGGPGTTCIKSPWYDMLWPLIALNSIREKTGYALRRKVWDDAFKPKALKKQRDKDLIFKYALQLSDHLATASGCAVNALQWFAFFSFDTMGEFAFARSFNMLQTGKWDDESGVKLVRDGMDVLGFISPVPWLAQIGFQIPGAADAWNDMIEWCKRTMSERLEIDVNKPDISYWLIEAQRNREKGMDMNNLYGDAVAVVIAGSHTTASSLTYIFYHLATNAYVQTKLRTELEKVSHIFDHDYLIDLPYLNAVISESLRLNSVLPTHGNRQTGSEGVSVAGHYIPPNTTIVAPRYTISRLESCFERAHEFIPERWTENPEMVKDKRAFQPFNLGRHSCPGRNIAMMELRIVIAMLITKFDISLAPGEDGRAVIEDMRDTFTAQPGDLELVFNIRIE